jgi:serine/threonine protein kinase
MISDEAGVSINGREYKLSSDDLRLGKFLGKGQFGTVRRGRIAGRDMPVAVKILPTGTTEERRMLLNEIRGYIQAEDCPFLVKWYGCCVSSDSGSVHIAMEFMDLGNLADLLPHFDKSGLPPAHFACIASQLVRGLEHMHVGQLLHRDIKPANVLVNQHGEIKLSDFGLTVPYVAGVDEQISTAGTSAYLPPESVRTGSYSYPGEFWSLGLVFYELATAGDHPYKHVRDFSLLHLLLTEGPEPRLNKKEHSKALGHFVARCLTRDPSSRADARELLRHDVLRFPLSQKEELGEWLVTEVLVCCERRASSESPQAPPQVRGSMHTNLSPPTMKLRGSHSWHSCPAAARERSP